MFDDLERLALTYRLEHGTERLREVLAPFMRPARRFDLGVILDRDGAMAALRRDLPVVRGVVKHAAAG